MRKPTKALLIFGLAAQALVPAWMLAKRHLILTQGERVTVPVELHDPRDLFMGHYVQLKALQHLPQLNDVPTNYLRYYCDQRYAKRLERATARISAAELDVRVWRGNALATELRIGGRPAYDYVKQEIEAVVPLAETSQQGKALARLPRGVPRVVLEQREADMHMGFKRQSIAYFALPLLEAELWHTVREELGMRELDSPRTPKEKRSARSSLRRAWSNSWYYASERSVLPLFNGLPFPCERPLKEQATAYYRALAEIFELNAKTSIAFEGGPGPFAADEAWRLVRNQFPKAEWLYEGKEAPPGVPGDCLVFLLAEAPETPPLGVRWAVRGKTLEPLERIQPAAQTPEALHKLWDDTNFDSVCSSKCRSMIDTFAAHALARYAETKNPKALRLADRLLRYDRSSNLHLWFEQCDTYAEYCDFLRWLRDTTPEGEPVPFGGWLEAEINLDHPPEPTPFDEAATKASLRPLFEALLAL